MSIDDLYARCSTSERKRIDRLTTIAKRTPVDRYWAEVRRATTGVRSCHTISSWQALAELVYTTCYVGTADV